MPSTEWTPELIRALLSAPTQDRDRVILYNPTWYDLNADGVPRELVPQRFEIRKAVLPVETFSVPPPHTRPLPRRGDVVHVMGIPALVDSVEVVKGQMLIRTWVEL